MPNEDEAASGTSETSETSEPAETEPNTSDLSDDNTDTDSDADATADASKVDEQMAFLDEGMNAVDGLDNDSLEVGAENADADEGDKSAPDAATATPAVVSPDADADAKSAAEAKPIAGEKAPEATKPEAKTDETKAAPAVSEEPAKVEPAKPEVKAVPEVKPATPEAGPKPSPEPSQETPPETQMTQEQAQTYLADMRGAAIGQLEQRYAMSDEEVELLRDSPELALPKFGAALFFDAVTQAINAVQAQLPAAIASYMQSSQVETSAEDAFYQTWPDLKDQDPGTVRRIGAAYRAQNPNASAEDFTRDVGASAMVALRVPFTGAAAPNGSAAQTVAQAQVQVPVVVPVPAQKPFTPALGGGSAPASGPPAAENLITEADRQMFEETDELDAD